MNKLFKPFYHTSLYCVSAFFVCITTSSMVLNSGVTFHCDRITQMYKLSRKFDDRQGQQRICSILIVVHTITLDRLCKFIAIVSTNKDWNGGDSVPCL